MLLKQHLSYKEWLHGEAVGCGMLMAADLSMRLRLGLLDPALIERYKKHSGKSKLAIENS